MLANRTIFSRVSAAFASLLACAMLASALLAIPQAFADDAPTWTYVGRRVTLSDPIDLKWWYGDKATVTHADSSLTMEMMHCLQNGEFKYSFMESTSWSEPPASIVIGDEASLVITGTMSLSKMQFSDYYTTYLSDSEGDMPVAGLDVRMEMGYFDLAENRDATYEVGKRAELYGQTEFPNFMVLGSMHLEGSATRSSEGHSVLLSALEDASIDFSVTGDLESEATNWNYSARIAQGDYTIGNTTREAQAYVLILTVEDIGAGYSTEYYYEFIPGQESVPYVPGADTGNNEGPAMDSQSYTLMLSTLMLAFFGLCCGIAYAISSKRKKRKAESEEQ